MSSEVKNFNIQGQQQGIFGPARKPGMKLIVGLGRCRGQSCPFIPEEESSPGGPCLWLAGWTPLNMG